MDTDENRMFGVLASVYQSFVSNAGTTNRVWTDEQIGTKPSTTRDAADELRTGI